ncbi:DUF2851 family protein [Prosthecobacter sp.]|uniref:DUF2851 family protein n=1 Tax=Prosthecobacter sp. TaxID=1965333 RepID=UPI001E19AF80|nr:DUF2851 family protein [Prosthecobacter sp.]MCB1275231.1 DUF2851 family protein [Prosthecobacter sp.]
MTSLPLADRYARFRSAVFSGVEEGLPGFDEPTTEMELQSLWFSGAFGSEFTTTDGKAVRIADFGVWNSGAGPDFNDCAIVIDDQTLRGDIELDPDARDWERHTHGANEAFNHVVLHLFLHAPEHRFFTRTSEHREVPQVLLRADMLPEGIKPKRRTASAHLGRCATPLRDMDDARVQSIIESAAQHRLELKSKRLHRSVAAQGREQAVYQALAQTLGYRKNQQPFAILAQRLPLKKITQLDAAKREAWLFGVSGFLEGVRSDDTEPATRSYLRQLWSEWWKLRESCGRWLEDRQLPRWKLNAIRPGNHPQRRLGALAAMLRSWKPIIAPLADATRWSQAAWRESLLVLTHEFWATHYTLLSDVAEKPVALIGETRVQEMLANVAYPLLVPERTRLWAEYLELPALLDNQKVRLAVQRLFGDDPRGNDFRKKLHQQQGLLQIYEDFCLEDDSACANCPFPERLKEWG